MYTSASTSIVSSGAIEPSSLMPIASLDPKVLHLTSLAVNVGVVDHFLDTLAVVVAHATSGDPHKAILRLKTMNLCAYVVKFIDLAKLDARTVLTATSYFSRMQGHLLALDGGPWLCERLAGAALMVAYKYNNDARTYQQSSWHRAAQHFHQADVKMMERQFLNLIDYRCTVSNADLLEHYEPVMQYVHESNDAWTALSQPSIFSQTSLSAAPLVPKTEDIEPELLYPDSPMSDDWNLSSDGELDYRNSYFDSDSEDSSEVITPPHSAESSLQPTAHIHASSTNSLTPETTHAVGQQTKPFLLQMSSDLEARVRFYAADRGTIVGPNSSPRFVPYSPSLQLTQETAAQQAPAPCWQQLQPPQLQHDAVFSHPQWHPMQNWTSTMGSVDTTWGTLGLFRN